MKATLSAFVILYTSLAAALPAALYLTARGTSTCLDRTSITLLDQRTLELSANTRFRSPWTCIYNIPGGFNGAQAIAVLPKDADNVAPYEAELSIQRRLDELILETTTSGGGPVAISRYPVRGKPLRETSRYSQLLFTHRQNRSPSNNRVTAWRECSAEVMALQQSVVNRLEWFAEQGVVFDEDSLSTGYFSNTPASTVGLRFDDAWTSAEITIDDYVPSHIASDAEFSRDDWEAWVRSEIPVATGFAFDGNAGMYGLVQGPCGQEPESS